MAHTPHTHNMREALLAWYKYRDATMPQATFLKRYRAENPGAHYAHARAAENPQRLVRLYARNDARSRAAKRA